MTLALVILAALLEPFTRCRHRHREFHRADDGALMLRCAKCWDHVPALAFDPRQVDQAQRLIAQRSKA